ncbi:MAG: DUF805 domain-containing protein [Clostridia bacterium]|nr:DUF805 domain-containing protein [Clostridia bacterium]
MQCPACGREYEQTAKFCEYCGVFLHEDYISHESVVKEYSFTKAYEDYWSNAFNFSGRARRKEFWFACIWNFMFVFVISLVGKLISHDLQFALEVAFYAGVLIPNLSLAFRRIHDIGKSAYWLFIGFIPLVGHIILAVLFALDGDKNDNAYGKSTKYVKGNSSF